MQRRSELLVIIAQDRIEGNASDEKFTPLHIYFDFQTYIYIYIYIYIYPDLNTYIEIKS